MRIEEILLLVFCLGVLWYFVRNDIAEYAAFKLLSDTLDRQRRYRVWIVKAFIIFSGTSVLGLAILHRPHALIALPPEFGGLSAYVRSFTSDLKLTSGFLIGMCIPIAIGMVIGVILMKKQSSKTSTSKSHGTVAGDIEPLMPRNWPETAHTAVLSLNAGLSEELLFRLLLPLLLALLSGSASFAFILAALIFGTLHAYQGPIGVLLTTVLGLALTGVYLTTGNIWIAVALHAAIDIVGVVVRPTIARLTNSGSSGHEAKVNQPPVS